MNLIDSVTFIGNLQPYDSIASAVVNCFDELMVLYRLIGDREDTNINIEENDLISATFNINTTSKNNAEKLYNNLNGTSFNVFNSLYNISMELSGKSIYTTIVKATSI